MQDRYAKLTIAGRSKAAHLETDTKVVQWIAQTAVDVELFTIPLYMTSLYSVAGMHQITGNNDFYQGRQWPGSKTSIIPHENDNSPDWPNRRAYNLVFSVFIQEMLHLQMAANIATAIGVKPSFTSSALQDDRHGWTCYGPTLSVIPRIVDLKDTSTYQHVAVNIGPLNQELNDLFLAIEQPTETAEKDIVRNKDKYFPIVPFDDGKTGFDIDTADIMFGSIGWMYQCFKNYLAIEYDDHTTLWDNLFDQDGQQNDLFNSFSYPGHPMREFMGFETTVALTDKDIAYGQVLKMMDAITDQGEGSTLSLRLGKAGGDAADLEAMLQEVREAYRSDPDALISDYPNYTDTGVQAPSTDAPARYKNDDKDHFKRFMEVKKLLDVRGAITTWDIAGKAGNWTEQDLVTKDYSPANPYNLPTPAEVAQSLNTLYTADQTSGTAQNYTLLSQAVVGAIKGVTTVLDDYWNPATPGSTVSFPFPSMAGSGDRMSTCWAVFGKAPDLSIGIDPPTSLMINHACQGLISDGPDRFKGNNSCAEAPVYHTCRGSNLCKGMGGCGFAQLTSGGGGCGASATRDTTDPAPVGAPTGGQVCGAVVMRAKGGQLCGHPPGPVGGQPNKNDYTSPTTNFCGGFGGCAVPISASQIYPVDGVMDVYQLTPHGCGFKFIDNLDFKKGDKVENIAYQAYAMWAKSVGAATPPQQPPNDIRKAFPPST